MITWLPLLILTIFEGTVITGVDQPFLKDVTMQARVLLALPMLILIKESIRQRVIAVLKFISGSLMSRENEQKVFHKALKNAKRLTSSALTETIFLILVIGTTISFVKAGVFNGLDGETRSWLTTPESSYQKLSLAGYWAVCVSIPIFQFLLIRWVWRYIVWILFLFRISKSNLHLLPTHPDRSCGVAVIMLAQKSFSLIFLAGSILISGQFVNQLLKDPGVFESIRSEAIAYIVISLVVLILPLVFFIGKLVHVKNEGMLQMSVLGSKLSDQFEQEWVNDQFTIRKIEDQVVDPSMVFDYGGMYDSLCQIRILPANLRDIVTLGILLFVPFIPILFIHFSVAELVQKIAKLLI